MHDAIAKRFPEHLAEYVVATRSGMRISEQYTVESGQYDPRRRAVDLDRNKNGNSRTVNLNADAVAAIESVRRQNQKLTDRMFPREHHSAFLSDEGGKRKQEQFGNRSWFGPCVTGQDPPDHLARTEGHFLLVARYGWSNNARNHGCGRAQDDESGGPVSPTCHPSTSSR